MTEVRYGFQEGEVDGLTVEPQIQYPNTEETSPDRGPDRDVFDADPALFYVRGRVGVSPLAARWVARTVNVPVQPILIAPPNDRRSQLSVFTDNGNTVPVFLSHEPSGIMGNGAPAIALAPATAPLIFYHTGAVYVYASIVGQLLYTWEESFR